MHSLNGKDKLLRSIISVKSMLFPLLFKIVLASVVEQSVLHMLDVWDNLQCFNLLARHWEHDGLEEG